MPHHLLFQLEVIGFGAAFATCCSDLGTVVHDRIREGQILFLLFSCDVAGLSVSGK